MAAISKAWVTIGDPAVDPDSPGDATLMTGIRDDLVHLREWIGASFFGGAVQDHNHDGSNSALIQVGPNYLRNGSFEDGETAWTFTNFSGGSHAISTSVHRNGAKSAAITSTVAANGGGEAVSNEFLSVSEGDLIALKGWIGASAANVSSKIEVIWYDNAKSLLSATTMTSYTGTPTSLTFIRLGAVAPSNARWAKVRLTGGVPGVGAGTGTITFDGMVLSEGVGVQKLASGSLASTATLDIVMTAFTAFPNKLLVLRGFVPVNDLTGFYLRFSSNGGSSYDAGSNYRYASRGLGSNGGSADLASASATQIELSGVLGVGNAATEGIHAQIMLYDSTNNALHPRVNWQATTTEGTQVITVQGAGIQTTANDVDALRVLFGSGNIASGSWELYGFH